MELTGKAKEKFEKWYVTRDWYNPISINTEHTPNIDFYDLPKSMQWGVYQDWADSLGYALNTVRIFEKVWSADVIDWNDDEVMLWEEYEFTSDQQARDAAVDKLNELINGK